MIDPHAWGGRFRSRLRKWLRDPAAFADELPSRRLREVAVFGMAGVTVLAQVCDTASRRARAAWRRDTVSLRHVGQEGADFRFLDAHGLLPRCWPDRVVVDSPEASAVVVAFAKDGSAMTAAEVGPGRPGVIDLGGRPSWAKVYRVDNGGTAPDQLAVQPVGKAQVADLMLRRGLPLAEALRRTWPPFERRAAEPPRKAYGAWIARNEPDAAALQAIAARVTEGGTGPRISVLMPVHDPRPADLKAAIESVRTQFYGAWSLCIADDGSRSGEVRRVLRAACEDDRVRLVRHEDAQGVAAATNAALGLADGDVALFLDHDDLLAPHALALVADAFLRQPGLAAVYSDEDKVDAHGRRSAPVFKSDLDRERLLAQNYVNHLFAVRLDLLRRLGGVRTGLEGAQDHDLVLRVVESGEGPILHLPHVLYHWRIFPGGSSLSQRSKARVDPARVRLVRDHLERTGRAAELEPGPGGHLIVRRGLPAPEPEVLAIVPTRDRPGLLQACIAGLLDQTDYPSLQICVVDNGSQTPAALTLLERLAATPRVRVLRIDAPFNFSALNNAAAEGSGARLLAFVNDDVMVVEPGWLRALAAPALEPDVGAVGAKLFYPDGRIQHAGIVLGVGPQRVAGHEFRGAPGDSPGPQNRLLLTHETSAVTAACMVVEKRKFDEVGGFDAKAFPVAFNDVDLCLRLNRAGYRTLWTPQARLMHLESATRGSDRADSQSARFAAESARMRERWGPVLAADPYYNPNLTIEDESFTLAERSRATAPWL